MADEAPHGSLKMRLSLRRAPKAAAKSTLSLLASLARSFGKFLVDVFLDGARIKDFGADSPVAGMKTFA